MKDERHPPRQHEHPTATVIHQHEDETVLAGWLRRAMEQGPRFWILMVGMIAAALGLGILTNHWLSGKSTSSEAWLDLTLAKTSEEQLEVARNFPESVAARWAELEAATMVYNQAFDQLPMHRDAASPLFKKAYELFSQVYEKYSKVDPAVARFAAFGMARTLEASNDLKRAIEQYQLVATTWPGTEEARRAESLAKALQNKKSAEFYDWVAQYKPSEVTLPPFGRSIFGDDVPMPFAIPPGVTPGSVPATELPSDVFEPDSTATPSSAPPADSAPATVPPSAPPSAPEPEPPKF
jgi:hypothetical protein